MLRHALIASLTLTACEDELAGRTDEAAERVTKAQEHLRHERRQLAEEMAARADDRVASRDLARHVDDIANQVADVTREAGRLAEAQNEFASLRSLRISSLRAEYSVVASQPLLIQAIAAAKPLAPAMRARLEESLAIFSVRLSQTRAAIDQLQQVSAADWERRDDEVGRAMAGLDIARDASWHDLGEHHLDERFPRS